MDEVSELKLEYERKQRMLENLKKNFERRKKLNLLEPAYERQIKNDMNVLTKDISYILRKIKSIRSEEIRKKFIDDK